jgi:hypothetical protein
MFITGLCKSGWDDRLRFIRYIKNTYESLPVSFFFLPIIPYSLVVGEESDNYQPIWV